MNDLKFAIRQLLKNPGFTAMSVLTLALGIGANTAIFSAVNGLWLRSLPFPNSDRLVLAWGTQPRQGRDHIPFSWPNFADLREQARSFESLGTWTLGRANLTGTGRPELVQQAIVDSGFFAAMGTLPLLGRIFLPNEDNRGGEKVAIISHALWARRFGGETNILGRSITLDGQSYQVVGVMPAGFKFLSFPNETEIWLPFGVDPFIDRRVARAVNGMGVIGRLKPGVALGDAQAEARTISRTLAKEHPENNGWEIALVALKDQVVAKYRLALVVLIVAVGFVLLIGCTNIANLLLARFAARRKEIAARFALGASRLDVVGQLVTESMLMAVLGGVVGWLLASAALRVIVTSGADLIPRVLDIRLDPMALAFTIVVTLVTGLAIGLLPALQASAVNVQETLKESSRGSTGTGQRLRAGLLIAEVSLSVVLLIGAGLLLISFARLQRVEPGFKPDGIFTAQIALPAQRYDRPKLIAFYENFYQRLKTLPGISSAALSDRVPLTGGQAPAPVAVQGTSLPPLSERPQANRHLVSPGYFHTLGIPFRAGRDFDERDSSTVPHVVIVNETFARRFFPGADPIGRTLVTGMAQLPSQIVGLVADVRSTNLSTPPEADYFLPALQRPETFTNVLIRTNGSPEAIAPAVREALRSVDGDLPLLRPQALTTLIAQNVADRRLALMLLASFAALALVLASLGVYSVMAHLVTFRTSEIGIRMALGATPGTVMRMVLGHSARLTLVGIVLGVAGGFVVSRLMRQALFEVNPANPLFYLAVSGTLLLVAVCASWFPARRATRIDPVRALRMD